MSIAYDRMVNLIEELNKASDLYYNTGNSFLTDKDFDDKMKELSYLESSLDCVLSNSPTINVGYKVLDSIEKIKIESKPMLSLEKVYTLEAIKEFAEGQELIGMIKYDGLSVRLIYENGKLISANTRGDGYIGANITKHAAHFTNIPLTIPAKFKLIVDGEAIIKHQDFEELNKNNDFSNPRNTAAGTLNLLDMKEVTRRKLSFILWDVIEGTPFDDITDKFKQVQAYGFEVAETFLESTSNEYILKYAQHEGFPCDGVVWKYNSSSYGEQKGATAHHYRSGIAWKREVETYTTKLLDIDWTMGRTGVLTPVAVLEPIEIDGTVVERANLHNLSVMQNLLGQPYVNQKVKVFKANEIIPQIKSAEKLTGAREEGIKCLLSVPKECPICGGKLDIECEVDSEVLKCNNSECSGQLINRLDHFCGKKGLDIKGLSKATLSKLVEKEWVNEPADLYNLKFHRDEWIKLPSFGQKSVDNILNAIEASKTTKLNSFISALGIPTVGRVLSKELVKYFSTYEDFRNKIKEGWDFTVLDGVAIEKASNIINFNYDEADKVYECMLEVSVEKNTTEQALEGKKIVITGTLQKCKNRGELQALIESAGGRVLSSISGNVDILINNNVNSTSSKNVAAKKLNIPILSEEEFFKEYLTF